MANFGDINTDLVLAASQAVRRNAANDAFEAFVPASATEVFWLRDIVGAPFLYPKTAGDDVKIDAELFVDTIKEYSSGVTIEGIKSIDSYWIIPEITAPAGTPAATEGYLFMDSADDHIKFKNSTTTYDLTDTGGGGMVYPGAGIALSTGAAWGTSIADNSTNWNTAYSHSQIITGNPHALDYNDVGAAAVSHVHGNITNAGAIGSTTNLPIITTTSGVLIASSFGTGANTFCQGNDARLSDSRTPTAHAMDSATYHTSSDVTTLDATTSKHGFLPKLGGGTTNFLRADGTWAAPSAGTTYYAGNGITFDGTTIDWGGDLDADVTIIGNAFDVNIGTVAYPVDNFVVEFINGGKLNVGSSVSTNHWTTFSTTSSAQSTPGITLQTGNIVNAGNIYDPGNIVLAVGTTTGSGTNGSIYLKSNTSVYSRTGTEAYYLTMTSSGEVIRTTYAAPGGSGDVVKSGSTTAGMLATWVGTGYTVQGNTDLTWNGTGLGIGVSAARNLDIVGTVIQGTRYENATSPFAGIFRHARGTSTVPIKLNVNDRTGGFQFEGWHGSGWGITAFFGGIIDGTVSTGYVPQGLTFQTGTALTYSERMLIGSDGDVDIWENLTVGESLTVTAGDITVTAGDIYVDAMTADAGYYAMEYDDATGLISYVSSDIKNKTNIRLWDYDALSFFRNLPIKIFDRTNVVRKDEIGWIAQDVQALNPIMVGMVGDTMAIRTKYINQFIHRAMMQIDEKVEYNEEKIMRLEQRVEELENQLKSA